MITKAIFAICLVGTISSLAMAIARFGWPMMAVDAVVLALIVSPYAVIVAVAWWRRASLGESQVILAIAILVATYGLWMFAASLARGLANTDGNMPMDLTAAVVPAVQGLVVSILAAAFGIRSLIKRGANES